MRRLAIMRRPPRRARREARHLVVVAVALLSVIGFLAFDRVARAQDDQTITFTRTVSAADTGRYIYLPPFDMPENVTRVDVELTKETGNAVTGLGIFDQRGADYGSAGFRGIYGEEFQQFFIEEEAASSAFVAGPIESGRWTIIVPVFRAAADRITVEVKLTRGSTSDDGSVQLGRPEGDEPIDDEVEDESQEPDEPRESETDAAAAAEAPGDGGGEPGGGQTGDDEPRDVEGDCPSEGTNPRVGDDIEEIDDRPGWYRGDLHDHTIHSSDACGSGSAREPKEFADAARDEGLDFVSFTDHNVTTQNRSLDRIPAADDVLVMPGLEMTNWFHGHATVTGLEPEDWLDWRQRPRPLPRFENERRIDDFIEASEERDTFTSAAHPSAGPIAWQFFQEAEARPELLPDGLETWTGPFQPDDDLSIEMWDRLLRRSVTDKRFRIVANGASDVHGFDNDQGFALAHPTTVAYADALSKGAVVDALEAGRSFITCLPDGPELYLSATAAGEGPLEAEDQRQMVGGTIYGSPATTADVSVLVRGGEGRVLTLIRDGETVQTTPITSNEQTVTSEQPIGAGGFVRAELRTAPEAEPDEPRSGESGMHAMTNPIFLELGPVPPEAEQRIVPPPEERPGDTDCPPTREGEGGEPDEGSGVDQPPFGGGGSGGGDGGRSERRDRGNDDDDDGGGGSGGQGSPGGAFPTAPVGPQRRLIRLFPSPRRVQLGGVVAYRFRAMAWVEGRSGPELRRLGPREPVPGVTVVFGGRTGVTDAGGYVTFLARLGAGPGPTASASKPGYRPGSARLLPALD